MAGTTKRWCVHCTGELRRKYELPERRCVQPDVVARREADRDPRFGSPELWCPCCPEGYEACLERGWETPILCEHGREPPNY